VARHIFQACPVWIYTQCNIIKHLIHLSTLHQHSKFHVLLSVSIIRTPSLFLASGTSMATSMFL
jgi:hypothetical protein